MDIPKETFYVFIVFIVRGFGRISNAIFFIFFFDYFKCWLWIAERWFTKSRLAEQILLGFIREERVFRCDENKKKKTIHEKCYGRNRKQRLFNKSSSVFALAGTCENRIRVSRVFADTSYRRVVAPTAYVNRTTTENQNRLQIRDDRHRSNTK